MTQRPFPVPDVLADRYATEAMRRIWSPEGRVVLERELWLAVLEAQRDAGLRVSEGAIEAYRRVIGQVDTESIRRREETSLHDVKARIEEFNALAGFEEIHRGMTSRDLTENTEQLQVWRSLELVRVKTVATLALLADRARQWRDLPLAARTHNVAAQPTTLGKRVAMAGEELLGALEALVALMERFAFRGLKGAVGTQLDQLTLFAGDAAAVGRVEQGLLDHLGVPRSLDAVGQVYPRSHDTAVVGVLFQIASAPSSFARTLRLMAGQGLASEGFAPGQTGSSAMPHKKNSRSCERVNGFHAIIRGYWTMLSAAAGDQWNEGDVSCSVIRRVALPGAFFALDGLFETFLTVLERMEAFPDAIAGELNRYGPFLATTTLLMEAVQAGGGRETMHELIKEHALAAAGELERGSSQPNSLAERLAADERIPLDRGRIEAILARASALTGAAGTQVDRFVEAALHWSQLFPDAASYRPGRIL